MKRFLFALPGFCFFLCAKLAFGQDLAVASKGIDSIYSGYTSNTPGCVIGVIKDGKWIFKKSYGSSNLDYNIPLSSGSAFYIASISKQFTAACINMLVLQQKISLDDRIRAYIPELPEYTSEITIRNLLHHTSGLRDYLTLRALSGESVEDYFNIQDCIDLLVKQKALSFSPGERFSYSNSGYVLLAELVNRVSGTSIRSYADQHLFKPLGMNKTFFNDQHNQVTKDRVVSYRKGGNDSLLHYSQNFDALGDGNVISTLDDLFLWDQNFSHGKLGGQKFLNMMLERGRTNDEKQLPYASGLFVDEYKSFKTVHHAGGFLGFRMELLRFPELGLSVIFLGNMDTFDGSDEAYQIADLFLPPPVPEAKGEVARSISFGPEDRRAFIGLYQSPDNPSISAEVSIRGDSLYAHPKWIDTAYATHAVSPYEFVKNTDREIRYLFSIPVSGKSEYLNLQLGRPSYRLQRIDRIDSRSVNLDDYIGRYYSEELDITYVIENVNGKLTFEAGKWGTVALEPIQSNVFFGTDEKVSFSRPSVESDVSGFVLSVGRAEGIRFSKVK